MQTILSLYNLHPAVWQTMWQIVRLFFYCITDFQVTFIYIFRLTEKWIQIWGSCSLQRHHFWLWLDNYCNSSGLGKSEVKGGLTVLGATVNNLKNQAKTFNNSKHILAHSSGCYMYTVNSLKNQAWTVNNSKHFLPHSSGCYSQQLKEPSLNSQ